MYASAEYCVCWRRQDCINPIVCNYCLLSLREVASTGSTNKLSVEMDRRRLAHPQPTAPMSPAGDTPDPCIGWRYFPATTLGL